MGKGASKPAKKSDATKREEATKSICKSAIRGAHGVQDCEDKVVSVFKEWDLNGSGKITRDELAAVLETMSAQGSVILPKGTVDALMKEADKDHNGEISYTEMIDWLFCAPNLEKYFTTSETIHQQNAEEAKKVAMDCKYISHHSNDQDEAHQRMIPVVEKFQKSCQDRIDNELTPLIKKAFAWHDKDSNGTLDYEESIIFFSNYANLLGPYLITAAELSITNQMQSVTNASRDPEYFKKALKLFRKKTKQRMQVYLASKDKHHKAAFKLLDINGNGKLYEPEVVEALLHGHLKNQELMAAFGLVVPTAEIIAELAEPGDALGAADCNMQ